MQRYWFDKSGALAERIDDHYICVDVRSEYSYSMSTVNKRGELKGVITGDFTRVSAMFQRYTSKPLILPGGSKFYNAYLEPCASGGLYKQEGLALSIKEGALWKPVQEKVRPAIYYYDADGCPCGIEDAVEQFAVTVTGARYALDKDGGIVGVCPLDLKNKRNFYTKDMQPTTASYALFRVIGNNNTGMADVYIRSMSSWVRHSMVPAFHLKQEILTAGVANNKSVYYDEHGAACPSENAAYSVVTKIPGVLLKLYKGETLVRSGTPRDIQEFIDKLKVVQAFSTRKPDVTQADNQAPISFNTVGTVWDLCGSTAHIKRENLASALLIMCSHNRRQKGGPVFDTLLHDSLWQPIYIVDSGYSETDLKCTLSKMHVVRSLPEAQRINGSIESLPMTFRWSTNPSDMVWNPSIPLTAITQRQIAHVCMDNIDRLPAELQSIDTSTLMLQIKQEVEKGARTAACDVHYALPLFSAEHGTVSMILPIRVPLLYGDRIVAVAVLCKSELGYRLCTIITTEMARTSVAMLTDISSTWLKEG